MTKKPSGRFAALSELRAERSNEEVVSEPGDMDQLLEPQEIRSPTQAEAPSRGRGRPKGRRSDPDYTQISAYIPLDLLLGVQDALSEERRQKRQRTARPVSDLIEALLADWLNTQKRENSDI